MEIKEFTAHPEVLKIIEELKLNFSKENPLIVSDLVSPGVATTDGELQYVNLVQEGGGVLGVALVGYTYVLEQMGIRFFSLAGTSAGAINTMLLAAIKEKQDAKSTDILNFLSNKNLFDFVDGNWLAKFLIKRIFNVTNYITRIISRFKLLALSMVVVPLLCVIVMHFCECSPIIINTFMILYTLVLLLFFLIFFISKWLIKKFFEGNYGINPGNNFYSWVANILNANEASSLSSLLKNKIQKLPPGIGLRSNRTGPEKDLPLEPKIAIIASDVTTQVKIQFPLMADLYWTDFNQVHPAEFVRASMSIPIFFESHRIQNIQTTDKTIIAAWKYHLEIDPADIPSSVRFVDGGMLSNFPINIFYNPDIAEARMPTFGIKLDSGSRDSRNKTSFPNFGSYIWAIFNTIRYYYDKDFLLQHAGFQKSIGHIDVHDFNWLNFGVSNKEKIDMFIKGASAAKDFLLKFDWQTYKTDRTRIQVKMNAPKKSIPGL